MRYITAAIAAAALAITAVSCAKESKSSANELPKQYIEAWIQTNYPGVSPSGIGIYVIEDTPGTGVEWKSDLKYAIVDYTVTYLDGTVYQTNSEKLSRQLGTYSITACYDPVIWPVGKNYCYAGVEEMLSGMKVGGTRKAVIPSWLLTLSRYDSAEDYLAEAVDAKPLVFTVTLRSVTADIKKYCFGILDSYVRSNIDPSLDSTYYNNADGLKAGFYFKSELQPSDSIIPAGKTGYLWYVGRRLDGKVFDTNIADTAKVYGIYSSSRTYAPAAITFADPYTDIKMDDSSLITGFQAALCHMHAYEKATTVFYYGLGYGGTSKTGIPAYSSLQFDIELVDKP